MSRKQINPPVTMLEIAHYLADGKFAAMTNEDRLAFEGATESTLLMQCGDVETGFAVLLDQDTQRVEVCTTEHYWNAHFTTCLIDNKWERSY